MAELEHAPAPLHTEAAAAPSPVSPVSPSLSRKGADSIVDVDVDVDSDKEDTVRSFAPPTLLLCTCSYSSGTCLHAVLIAAIHATCLATLACTITTLV